jgi:hypothetical protein
VVTVAGNDPGFQKLVAASRQKDGSR